MGIKCPKCNTDNPETQKFCGECASPLPSPKKIPVTETLETPKEELTTGATFAGRYQIIEELGKGGMGKVYKALDTDLKEKVAIKLIKPEVAADKNTIERFRNELKFARKIRHKNVCQMYDLNKEEGTHYITMEYVHGEDLKRLIRKIGQMSAGQVISIAIQVCEGMAEAHRLGVVHRDLKPQNIMVDEEGNARIMDFGIARSVKGKGITGAGVMIGTPEYMSPEQVEGKESDQRSDIYSLGVILYEMVTERVPFEGDTPFTIGVKHKSEAPQNPKEFNSQIPDDLSNLILRCMEKDREQRYQSAGELRFELKNIEKGIPTTEKVIPKRKPITSKEITVKLSMKKLLLPAFVVVVVIASGLILWRPWKQKTPAPIPSNKPSLAVMYFDNNTGDEELEHWRKSLADLLTDDLIQSKHLRVLGGDQLYGFLKELDLIESSTYSAEDLQKVAEAAKISHLLIGNYSRLGQTFILNVQIKDMYSGETLESLREEARSEEEIWPKVDSLTKRIKENLGFSADIIAQDIDRDIGKITTGSPEAFKYFVRGRSLRDAGDNKNARLWLKKAVETDPEFAMAYRLLAGTGGSSEEREEYFKKAFELRDKVSERERLLIEQYYYQYYKNDLTKSIDAGEKVLKNWPEDVIARVNLGNAYADIGELEKSLEQSLIVRQIDPNRIYWMNAAHTYRNLNQYDKTIQLIEDYLKYVEERPSLRNYLAYYLLEQGNLERALEEIEINLTKRRSNWDMRIKGHILLVQGDWAEAEKIYIEKEYWNDVADLRLIQGRFKEAIELLEEAVEPLKRGVLDWTVIGKKYNSIRDLSGILLRSKRTEEELNEAIQAFSLSQETEDNELKEEILVARGTIQARMNSWEDAERTVSALKNMMKSDIRIYLVMRYNYLLGSIAFERQKYPEALDYFSKALSLQRGAPETFPAYLLDSLARVHEKMRDTDRARDVYAKITKLTTGWREGSDAYVMAFYKLAKIHEQQGDKAKAIDNYKKFLDLWKDADPGIAEVEDAKKRLAGLKRSKSTLR